AGTQDRRCVPRACARTQIAEGIGDWGLEIGCEPLLRWTPLLPNRYALVPTPYAVLSSVARRAARELLNLILGHQPLAELELIGRRHVVDAEHRRARPHVALRVAVAVEAPFHLQRVLLHHQRHPID